MIIWILINRWSLFMWGAGWDNDNDDHNEDSLSFPLHCFDFQDISTPKNWSDFEQFIINYRDIVEKPSSHGGGCDVLDMWPDLGASMKKWEWPESNGTDEKWKCPFKAFWLKCQQMKLKTNFEWGKLTGLYKTERMGQARYTRRDLDGAQGKPAENIRTLVHLHSHFSIYWNFHIIFAIDYLTHRAR